MSQTFIKGTIIITLATLISKILGSFFRIPLQNIAGDEVNGIFQMVYPIYMIALILSVAGIPIAISKLISEARAENNSRAIRDIFVTASIIALAFGIASFTMMYIFSRHIAFALGGEFVQLSIMVVSTTLIFAPYMAVYRGFFQGFEDMRPTAISQVLEQFVRFLVTLSIAYMLVKQQASNEVISGWIMLGSIAGVLFSLMYLRLTYSRSIIKPKVEDSFTFANFKNWTRKILSLSIPIAIGAVTMALLNMVDSLTIPNALGRNGLSPIEIQYEYGIYGRGLALVQIGVVFSSAVILPLIPLISKTMVTNGLSQTNKYIERSLKFAHLISWPIALGLLTLAYPMNLTLFENLDGSFVIAILGLSALFTSYTVLTTGVLQGLNRSAQVAWLLVILTVVKGMLNIYLVRELGVAGGAWSTLIIYFLLTLIHLVWLKKVTSFKLNLKELIVVIVASAIMAGIVAGPLYFFDLASWSRISGLIFLMTVIPLGAMIYAMIVYKTGVITKEEIKGFPVIGRVLQRL